MRTGKKFRLLYRFRNFCKGRDEDAFAFRSSTSRSDPRTFRRVEEDDAGPVLDDRSSSHPARCRDSAAGERFIETTRLRVEERERFKLSFQAEPG